ncbi:hypothetical protein CASFOL_034299 [Castilleja foliolosa]|uniref:Uncharacterized protein n=1 Tax=Castilleja foliolosa TaxID=1961234 RepID=A0ABD3BX97_9LAMI
MGFGGLLEFNIAETPSTLGYWLLENFDLMACVVKLEEGRELRVEAYDVTHVLGIPNGDTIIKRKAKNIPHPIVSAWRALFPVHLKSITATHVSDKMLSEGPKTIWFKRLFLILITTCLVESCDNEYVITRIIPNFEEPDRVRDLNWGQYMKKCLAEEVVGWNKKNMKEAFTGPLVFLLLVVFDEENFELIREDIMTLGSGLGVAQSVVDVWSFLINKREHIHSPSSPARFFATLDVHLHTVVYPKEDLSRTDCEEVFVENLQGSFNESATMKLDEVDIVCALTLLIIR